MINICTIKKTTNKCNSSPQLVNEPIGFFYVAIRLITSIMVVDTVDYDSFSPKLAYGLNSLPSGTVNYASPFQLPVPNDSLLRATYHN
ncbi:MAG: hypothetical protein IPI30_14965 [Saprospiraceae bacterium]|nr:hypothetical protein [Candidatus Vicinibacter affinis]